MGISLWHFGICVDHASGSEQVYIVFHVQVLRVFAHDDHINRLSRRANGFHGPDIRVEVELLAERDDGRGVPLYGGGGRGHGAEERAVAGLLEGFDGGVREGGAGLFEGFEAGVQV